VSGISLVVSDVAGSIAMGNASDEVKRRASYVASPGSEAGLARAIERCILGGAGGR
jgi:hydroxymethylpyrimidine pyrophosphatase-like HAD family hydrolase